MRHIFPTKPALARMAATAALAAACATPVMAATLNHPPLMPTQDATVTYTVQAETAAQPRTVTVIFGDEGRKMRIDFPQGQGYSVIDREHRNVLVVMNPQRAYMQLDSKQDLHNPFMFDATMQFTRTGTSTVAGTPCTTWQVTAGGTSNTTACVTDGGIVLSEDGVDVQGHHGHLQATAVSLAPVPASAFVQPDGYTRIAHPNPGSGQAPGATPGAARPQLGPNGQ